VVRFLKAGDKVKITIMFRGREQSRPELGFRLLKRLAEDVTELGYVEFEPKQDGRNMIMVMAPHRKAQQQHRRPSDADHTDETHADSVPADTAQADALPDA
jgi:translation initiation factor IF-3